MPIGGSLQELDTLVVDFLSTNVLKDRVHCGSRAAWFQPSERDQSVSFEPPDLHHRSPDPGELQCKPGS
jgi:hypothetical protein